MKWIITSEDEHSCWALSVEFERQLLHESTEYSVRFVQYPSDPISALRSYKGIAFDTVYFFYSFPCSFLLITFFSLAYAIPSLQSCASPILRPGQARTPHRVAVLAVLALRSSLFAY